ncbi:hypothetical protein AAFF_G00390530 [Aldrovandia affinis]|uniref:Uncharacterized protein n=1 Tax=Aldrovandia affinis TaxID=143900 RepID=A0AAD7WL72_9TELE|nr:hypothetical protein AAFF_G00390530 [Aldrovandia affinis]
MIPQLGGSRVKTHPRGDTRDAWRTSKGASRRECPDGRRDGGRAPENEGATRTVTDQSECRVMESQRRLTLNETGVWTWGWELTVS